MTINWPFSSIHDLTDQDLDEMRNENKIKSSFTREKTKIGHIERSYDLVAVSDRKRSYQLFTRKSITNHMVFSVGLTLVLPEKNLILCRYNGGYHGHKNILESTKLPIQSHRHITTARYIAAGLSPDGYAEIVSDYTTMEDALKIVLNICNISGIPSSIAVSNTNQNNLDLENE